MARRRSPDEPVPERMCRFIAGEWPEPHVWDSFAAWKQARHAWGAAHPESVLGDIVDMLRGERDARLRVTGVDGRGPV